MFHNSFYFISMLLLGLYLNLFYLLRLHNGFLQLFILELKLILWQRHLLLHFLDYHLFFNHFLYYLLFFLFHFGDFLLELFNFSLKGIHFNLLWLRLEKIHEVVWN